MRNVVSNLKGLQSQISESDFDVVVAMSVENVGYTSGVLLWSQRVIRDRLAFVVIDRGDVPTFIVASNEEGFVRANTWIQDVRTYVQHQTSPIDLLAETIKEKGLSTGRIGIEPSYLPVEFYFKLTKALPEATFLPCEPIFERVRMIKTSEELEILTRAGKATEKALMATYSTIRPGDTEHALVARLGGNIIQAGADLPAFLFLTVGSNTSYAHPDPTDCRVKTGDLIKSDCGGYFSGYYSDIGRTAVIGKASHEQRSIYQRILEVHQETIAAMIPGKRASAIFNVAVEAYCRVKIPFALPFAGHGVGLFIHETPMLSADDNTPIQPNMIFSVETRVRWPDREGYHIEDVVVIKEHGPEIVTTFMDTSNLMEL